MDPKVIDFMNQLQLSATQAGRQVLDVAVITMYWQSLTYLVIGGLLSVFGFWLFVFGYRRVMSFSRAVEKGGASDVPFHVCAEGVLGVVGLCCLVPGLVEFLNPWGWVGVFAPRIALFYQIYDKIINK
jgi:hypothetical protein